MKIKKIAFYVTLGILTFSCFKNVSRETYHSDLFVVKNVSHENNMYKITFENNNGFQYVYNSEDGDFYENEIYTAIMENNKTKEIYDDKIIELKYQGNL